MEQDQDQDQEQSSSQVQQQPPLLTLDGRSYNLLDAPDSIRILVADLTRIAQEASELQFRLRHIQLSQQAYIVEIEKEIQLNNLQVYSVDETSCQDNQTDKHG